ncbi:hypothetical protein DaDZ19_17350 [Dickeya ananatis]
MTQHDATHLAQPLAQFFHNGITAMLTRCFTQRDIAKSALIAKSTLLAQQPDIAKPGGPNQALIVLMLGKYR